MIFKLGDKVSFLNDRGGGIVTKVIDDTLVHVTIEDGFEIPVLAKELIRTGTAEIAKEIEQAHQNLTRQYTDDDTTNDILPLYLAHNDPDQRPAGIYFCFVPEIQENPLSGSLELLLINHTPYHTVFSLFLNHSGHYHGTEYGFIDPESRLSLSTIGRSEIEKWANALFQSVFFKEGKYQPLAPASKLISFKPIKLYKEESFQYETFLRKKALFVPVARMAELSKKSLIEEKAGTEFDKELLQKDKPANMATMAKPKKQQESFLDKHKIDDKIAEVDLHIGELIDNFTNLDKNDLLNIQLDYFRKCLNQAAKERLYKVIFIHGIGNGVLKTEINKILEKQDGIDFYDAPYARYGMGATEVNFYRNK